MNPGSSSVIGRGKAFCSATNFGELVLGLYGSQYLQANTDFAAFTGVRDVEDVRFFAPLEAQRCHRISQDLAKNVVES